MFKDDVTVILLLSVSFMGLMLEKTPIKVNTTQKFFHRLKVHKRDNFFGSDFEFYIFL